MLSIQSHMKSFGLHQKHVASHMRDSTTPILLRMYHCSADLHRGAKQRLRGVNSTSHWNTLEFRPLKQNVSSFMKCGNENMHISI